MQMKSAKNANLMDTCVNLVDLDDSIELKDSVLHDLKEKSKGTQSSLSFRSPEGNTKIKKKRNDLIVKRKGGGSIINQRPLFSSDGE